MATDPGGLTSMQSPERGGLQEVSLHPPGGDPQLDMFTVLSDVPTALSLRPTRHTLSPLIPRARESNYSFIHSLIPSFI